MPYAFENTTLGRIDAFLQEIGAEKAAAAKKAETELGMSASAPRDPGGYEGHSSHPSAKAPGNVSKAEVGSHFEDNSRSVKETYPGASTDAVSPHSGGSQDSKQYSIGTHQSATGEDPSVEDNYKERPEDKRQGDRGGTHAEASAAVGEKYSSMQFDTLSKLAYTKLHSMLDRFAQGGTVSTKVAVAPAAATGTQPQAPTDAAGQKSAELSKQEMQALAEKVAYETITEAHEAADFVGTFYHDYFKAKKALAKKADDDKKPEDEEECPSSDMPPMNEMPQHMHGMPHMMHEEPPMPPPGGPGAGAAPPMGDMPPGAGGGMPPDVPPMPGGGGEHGGPDHAHALEQLLAALQELGIDPQEFEAAATHAGSPPETKAAALLSPRTARLADNLVKFASKSQYNAQDVHSLTQINAQLVPLAKQGLVRPKEVRGAALAERREIVNYLREMTGVR